MRHTLVLFIKFQVLMLLLEFQNVAAMWDDIIIKGGVDILLGQSLMNYTLEWSRRH